MAKKGIKATDVVFFFGGPRGCASCLDYENETCSICGKKYFNHGVTVLLETPKFPGELKFFYYLCGECIMSDPKTLAEKARAYEPVLRKKRDERGADKGTNIRWADELLKVADLFERIESIDAIPDGVMARHIGAAYQELNTPRRGKGKVA